MKIITDVFLYIICILFFVVSCSNHKQQNNIQGIDKKKLDESLENVNRIMIQHESDMIDEYVRNNNLRVIKTGTGLRYYIKNQGEGRDIVKGDIVTLKYELSLLTGELIYSSENDGYKTFLVSKGGVERGLEEAILKLKKNSEAILILPSHLAHGLLGDGNKIPPKATLIYNIKIIEVK